MNKTPLLVIPLVAACRPNILDVIIVIGPATLERMRAHDPAELIASKLPAEYQNKTLGAVMIAYADETTVIEALAMRGDVSSILKLVTRGWNIQPGDDAPRRSIKPPEFQ